MIGQRVVLEQMSEC